jgi:hypothetical protein
MQPVDVLGEEDLTLAFAFKPGQGAVRVVRQGLPEPPPADHAARQVATAGGFLGHERLETHGLRPLPVVVAGAVIRDTGIRAAAGADEYEQPLVASNKGLKCTLNAMSI